jgi:cytoskeletal protein RodZ
VNWGRNTGSGSQAGWPDLAEIRRSRKISLSEIGTLTNIREVYLTAVERGDLEQLPGGVYTTSYIRQYARIIDYPEQDLLALFRDRTAPSAEPGGRLNDTSPMSLPLRFFRRLVDLVS